MSWLSPLPTPKDEPWKYTNLRSLSNVCFIPQPIKTFHITKDETISLNLIHLENSSDAHHTKLHVSANCVCILFEQTKGMGEYAASSELEITLDQGAQLFHYKIQDEAYTGTHLSLTKATLKKDANYQRFALQLGGKLIRDQIQTQLMETGASCHISGAYLANQSQHIDTTSVIEHMAEHTVSRQVYKGTIDDQARVVFQGKIKVHPKAQKTDGYQLNKALLLSPSAEIDSKPELEIYANDVKCSHGATAGAIDEDALFYLKSRGITEEEAHNMLILAFLEESLDEIHHPEFREIFETHIHAKRAHHAS